MRAPMPSFVTSNTPAIASSFSVPSARGLLLTFHTVYHRWRGKGGKKRPSPFKRRELARYPSRAGCLRGFGPPPAGQSRLWMWMAVVDRIPIGCQANGTHDRLGDPLGRDLHPALEGRAALPGRVLGEERSGHLARQHDGDADAAAGQLCLERLAQRHDGRLARRVERLARRRHAAGDGGDVDDAAATRHERHGRTDAIHDARRPPARMGAACSGLRHGLARGILVPGAGARPRVVRLQPDPEILEEALVVLRIGELVAHRDPALVANRGATSGQAERVLPDRPA